MKKLIGIFDAKIMTPEEIYNDTTRIMENVLPNKKVTIWSRLKRLLLRLQL